jgi:7 transmembrane receptor (rhodopsin family)
VISIERYRALLYPFKPRISKSAVKYAIPVIWTLSGICAAPMAATLRVELFDDPHSYSGKKAFCYPSALSSPFNDSRKAKEEALEASTRIFAGYVVFLVAIQFIAPLIIIGFAYLNIAKHLWGSHMETPGERPNDVNSTRTKQRQKVLKY